jgi:hypothetical protein
MIQRRTGRLAALTLACAVAAAASTASAQAARTCESAPGGAGPATAAAKAFLGTLGPLQQGIAVRGFNLTTASRWSNLPLALAPRVGIRLGDLDTRQTAAAEALLRTALSSCGVTLLDDIRAADGVLKPMDSRKIGWDPANYFVAFLGEPSADKPWGLKVDGHHVAFNITFNAPRISATPLFDGVEPVEFKVGERAYAPLAVQAGAMRAVVAAVARAPEARLEGEFRDVTRGSTADGDTNFPITYPGGAKGRGVAYATLDATQKARVRAAIEAWVMLPNGAIAKPLLADYTTDAALAQTYVGFAGADDLSRPGSYVRIDGPRLWIEFVVQPAVGDPKLVHYHTIWRDKVADYGGAFDR